MTAVAAGDTRPRHAAPRPARSPMRAGLDRSRVALARFARWAVSEHDDRTANRVQFVMWALAITALIICSRLA